MKELTVKQVKEAKKSDTLVIYGCGYSINDLTDDDKENLSKFDSIGFNWFCKSGIPTTFYIIREQANYKKRQSGGERPKDLYEMMNSDAYIDSILLIHDQEDHSPDAHVKYYNKKTLGNFKGKGIIVKDIKLRNHVSGVEKFGNFDIFRKGIIHGEMTMNNVFHFAIDRKYKKLLFVGVDLNDSRYFWLEEDERRHTIVRKKKDIGALHTKAPATMEILAKMMKLYKFEAYTFSDKSMLKDIIPVWNKS